MNKQLRQFERESGLEIFGLGAKRDPWEAALEKYAELIVAECAQLVEDNMDPQNAWITPAFIKEHFGVAE